MTQPMPRKRIFLTGTTLAGTQTSARYIGLQMDPPFSVDETPYGASGGWDAAARALPQGISIRTKLRTSRFYDPFVDGGSDPRIAAECEFLRRVDGILLVADSQDARREDNEGRLERVRRLVADAGRRPEEVPLVFLLNKRDLPDVTPVEQMEQDLTWPGSAHVPGIATRGAGVLEAFNELLSRLAQR